MKSTHKFSLGHKKNWPGGRKKAPNLLRYPVVEPKSDVGSKLK